MQALTRIDRLAVPCRPEPSRPVRFTLSGDPLGAESKGWSMRLTAKRLRELAQDTGLSPASLAIVQLGTAKAAVSLHPDRPFYPASMLKVPLVGAILTAIAEGSAPLSLETPAEVTLANMTANDAQSPLQPGYSATVHELMHLAIARSDNVATNMLFDAVGRARATTIARERLGLRSTAFYRKLSGGEPLIEDPKWDGVHRNSHPVADAARLFEAIADDGIPHAALLREMLAAQQWNERLSGGLRSGDRFLHKTGDTDEVTHDGGILITNEGGRYVVVAYTEMASTPEHNARFAPFMRALRELL
jgi:beta-lactamase class A